MSAPNKIYAQITLFCNMNPPCAHCCYDSGPWHRDFMSDAVFEATLKAWPGVYLNVGGGEPTCHPRFWELMAMALRDRGAGMVWVATNGKKAHDAIILAEMVRKGEIRGVLSQDEWHEPISPLVVEFWRQTTNPNGKPVIRDIGKRGTLPVRSGRCDWGLDVCNGHGGPWVMWDGSVRQCGCLDAPVVGDVFGGCSPTGGEWKCWKGLMHPDKRHTLPGARPKKEIRDERRTCVQ